MATKIYFESFKGGTGVTTCCIGLGLALAEAGERTLIVDGDALSGSAMITAKLDGMHVYTLADYERGACRAKQTLVPHPKASNLCFSSALGLKNINAASAAVHDLDGLFDYILLDKIAKETCDKAVIVSEPYLPSIKSADGCRARLSDGGIKNISLWVNKLNGGQILGGEIPTAQEISAVLRLPLQAVIPEDLTLPCGRCKRETLKAFKTAAAAVTGKKKNICNVLSGYIGLGGFIKRKARERI